MSIPCDKTSWVPIIFYPVTLTLEFDLFSENFNLANNFWTVSARALILHMSDPSDKLKTNIFYPVNLTLEFDFFFLNIKLTLVITSKL